MVDNCNIQTEEYIKEEEKNHIQWKKKYDNKIDEIIELANVAFSSKSLNDIQALESCFDDKEMVDALKEVNDIAFVMIILDIYTAEMESGLEKTVFSWGNSLKKVVSVIRQIKFLLWEIEFLNDKCAGQVLIDYIKGTGVSMIALEYIVFISSFDKGKVVSYLERLLA